MTTTPITPAGTEPFKFPTNPIDGCCVNNPVTGAWYKYIGSRNSWVNAGSDADYDDGPINKRVDDIEQWLKNQLETFVTMEVEGTYIFDPYDSDDTFAIKDAFQSFGATYCRPGSRRNPGSPKWSNFENWNECTHIDIHDVPFSGPGAINWKELYEEGMGWTFYVTPAQPKRADGSAPPLALDNYAQLRIKDAAETTEGRNADALKTRFQVVPVASRGIVEAGKEYLIRFIKTVDEYPAVIVRHEPIDVDNYGEGTLWFNLADMQLHVLVQNEKGKQFVTANIPPDINQDHLLNKKLSGGGQYQDVTWGLNLKDNTQFSNNIHYNLNGHKHSYVNLYPAKKSHPGIEGDYWPVLHTLKPESGLLVLGSSASTPMIYAAYNSGSDQSLCLKHLVIPSDENDAARLADTHTLYYYMGEVDGDCDVLPGHFALFKNSGRDRVKDICLSRIDAYGNTIMCPINSSNRGQKIKNTHEMIQLIDPNGKVDYTNEVGKVLYEGYAHTLWYNDTQCFKEGNGELTVNGKKGTYGKGGIVYQLDNHSDDAKWSVHFEGYNAFVKGRKYIVKTALTK